MRVMCDTNVLVRAILSPSGAAAELLRRIAGEHVLISSSFQLAELLDVLRRPKIKTLHGRDEHQIRRVVSNFYKLAVVVPLPADLPAIVASDPKDNPIVMTAFSVAPRCFARLIGICTPRTSLHFACPTVSEFLRTTSYSRSFALFDRLTSLASRKPHRIDRRQVIAQALPRLTPIGRVVQAAGRRAEGYVVRANIQRVTKREVVAIRLR